MENFSTSVSFIWSIAEILRGSFKLPEQITRLDKDKLLFDQISGDMVNNDKLAEQARAGSKEKFKVVFEPKVIEAFVNRQGRNEKIVDEFMSNGDMRNLIIAAMLEQVYKEARR